VEASFPDTLVGKVEDDGFGVPLEGKLLMHNFNSYLIIFLLKIKTLPGRLGGAGT
jgi:hypothetical protein